ncbi:MAG: ABC transporter ATP-binding protein [Saprospiraceae bacterium]|nr:MAG: ABC transporter [Bacteroidetes bacterium OLB9]MCO6462666.1 ABC transporter ATP-binding protein [Saprospiraceae bacterium]MCZ2337705.1 ABC transporter ATP-binding protein [Chitinophagales bacterium]
MIKSINLQKIYSGKCVLNIQELDIPAGQCLGLVGNNGAGKTTFFSLILDLIQATHGSITNNGIEVSKNEEWKKFTNAFLDESFLIPYLTPEEYFYFVGSLRGMTKEVVNDFLLDYKDIFNDEILGQKKYIRDLSKGNQKKVGVIGALMGNPKVIILDEPFANLDPTTQFRLRKILKTLAEAKDKVILISSHDLMHTTDVCDRIVVLSKGTIVKDIQTNPETLKDLEGYFSDHIESEID